MPSSPLRQPELDADGAAVAAASSAGPWAIALSGLAALAVAMGIGRFAFTPLLPMMLHDGDVTLHQGGWLATWNYIGYFAGAVACMFLRLDAARMVRWGLVATVLLTAAMALPGGMAAGALWRTAAGVASAVVLVYTTTWCMQRLAEAGRPALGGFIFCGPGLGIAITGLSAFAMVAGGWTAAWGWVAFAVLGCVLVGAVWPVFRPAATRGGAIPAAGGHARHGGRLGTQAWVLTVAYGLAGFGYIITATFLPVIARQAMPGSLWADLFWPLFGASVAVGALTAVRIGVGHDNRVLLACAYTMQAVGVAIAALWPTLAGFTVSSLLAGLPFTALVLFAMHEARRLAGDNAAPLIGLMTSAYALGQIAGPPFATALVTHTGGFAGSLAGAAAALLVGAALFVWLRRVAPLAGNAPVD
ncbi:putative MFS family arabinose efflux permease [Cupriavidus gilardii J11]|uniref:Putative MFS family arabinose efflux permease n=1 Tax=Cupriavidus gilardii J11 TaxID=936133 RepID=A0A562BVH7_9BURK|nr:MFS transporter [Cupriavidus gilardii]TWG89247.1 putative MFS family arabinose efflux permease [Cupriavidus gilardii J11]